MICTLFKNILCIHHLRFLQSVRFHGNLSLITAKRTYLAVFFWYKCNNPIGFGEIFTDFSFVILHSFWYWFMFNAPYAPSLWRITTSGSTQMHLPSKFTMYKCTILKSSSWATCTTYSKFDNIQVWIVCIFNLSIAIACTIYRKAYLPYSISPWLRHTNRAYKYPI